MHSKIMNLFALFCLAVLAVSYLEIVAKYWTAAYLSWTVILLIVLIAFWLYFSIMYRLQLISDLGGKILLAIVDYLTPAILGALVGIVFLGFDPYLLFIRNVDKGYLYAFMVSGLVCLIISIFEVFDGLKYQIAAVAEEPEYLVAEPWYNEVFRSSDWEVIR